jgi:hypothetical protein
MASAKLVAIFGKGSTWNKFTLLYVQYCESWAKKLRIGQGKNKLDFRAAVKVGESGIFRWMVVYYLVMASLF